MKKSVFLLLALGIIFFKAKSSDDVLIKIHDREITKDEFLRIYNKNNNSNTVDNKSIDEYLDLFINFKLKVIEAEEKGYDTLPSFLSEFEEYRSQLVKPYFIDNDAEQDLIKEAYDRMQQEISASHILIRVGEQASPEDSLKAYTKAMEIRERILNGEDFAVVARATSDDQSAKTNDGYLGYFTVFSMVYPFESGAYTTPVGEVSMPVRSTYGYHLIKVHDKRESRGSIKIAHIMKAVPQGADQAFKDSMKTEIYKVYDMLEAGEDFAELAKKYSTDKQSGANGGELPVFSSVDRRVPKVFIDTCYSLEKDGMYTKPFQTDFGWHIAKRISIQGLKSFDELKDDLTEKVKKDPLRSKISEKMAVEKLKKEYNFKENKSTLDYFKNIIGNTIFEGKWDASMCKNNEVMFTLDGIEYKQQDFAQYLEDKQRQIMPYDISIYLNMKYKDFVKKTVIDYEESRLDEKYPDYKYLVQEYHDGILLFNLTDEMVWSKAVRDTAGLRGYYENNKTNYLWNERANATVYSSGDAKKIKALRKAIKKEGVKNAEAVEMVCDSLNPYCIAYESGLFEKGDNEVVDKSNWKVGVSKAIKKDERYYVVQINDIMAKEPKEFEDAAGIITSDYQNYLDKQWISQLRDKYEIEVNNQLLSTIKESN